MKASSIQATHALAACILFFAELRVVHSSLAGDSGPLEEAHGNEQHVGSFLLDIKNVSDLRSRPFSRSDFNGEPAVRRGGIAGPLQYWNQREDGDTTRRKRDSNRNDASRLTEEGRPRGNAMERLRALDFLERLSGNEKQLISRDKEVQNPSDLLDSLADEQTASRIYSLERSVNERLDAYLSDAFSAETSHKIGNLEQRLDTIFASLSERIVQKYASKGKTTYAAGGATTHIESLEITTHDITMNAEELKELEETMGPTLFEDEHLGSRRGSHETDRGSHATERLDPKSDEQVASLERPNDRIPVITDPGIVATREQLARQLKAAIEEVDKNTSMGQHIVTTPQSYEDFLVELHKDTLEHLPQPKPSPSSPGHHNQYHYNQLQRRYQQQHLNAVWRRQRWRLQQDYRNARQNNSCFQAFLAYNRLCARFRNCSVAAWHDGANVNMSVSAYYFACKPVSTPTAASPMDEEDEDEGEDDEEVEEDSIAFRKGTTATASTIKPVSSRTTASTITTRKRTTATASTAASKGDNSERPADINENNEATSQAPLFQSAATTAAVTAPLTWTRTIPGRPADESRQGNAVERQTPWPHGARREGEAKSFTRSSVAKVAVSEMALLVISVLVFLIIRDPLPTIQ